MLYDELDIVRSDKNKDWGGWDTFRMQEPDPCRKLTLLKPAEVVLGSWGRSKERGREELEALIEGPRTVEDNFGRG